MKLKFLAKVFTYSFMRDGRGVCFFNERKISQDPQIFAGFDSN